MFMMHKMAFSCFCRPAEIRSPFRDRLPARLPAAEKKVEKKDRIDLYSPIFL